MNNKLSRRSFLKRSALAGAAGVASLSGGSALLSSCQDKAADAAHALIRQEGSYYLPELKDLARPGRPLKAGVVGCGGRGSGAALNFLDAGPDLSITALGDIFPERVEQLAARLRKDRGIEVAPSKQFVGFDAYKQVIDSDIDIVILATPPAFRPQHFTYAVAKDKHSFLEKPLCIDPAGYRATLVAARAADEKNLCVVTGAVYRHQRSYVESFRKIADGAIGELTGASIAYNQGMLWYRDKQPSWQTGEWMLRDWVNWTWLSGDHIVEQHIHNIDVFHWLTGLRPASAVGVGSRQRRRTGNQYDNFSLEFEMENGIRLHSMCRQIDGCSNYAGEFVQGTRGSWTGGSNEATLRDLQGRIIWQYDFDGEKDRFAQSSPFVLEHVNLVDHIRSGRPINDAHSVNTSCLIAILGREAAYTGRRISWEEIQSSPQNLLPADITLGAMDMISFSLPVPGRER